MTTLKEREVAMETAIIVRGNLADPRHIEIEEPVTGLTGRVEVVLRAAAGAPAAVRDVFDLVASLTAGTRSKEDIDQQITEERASWEDR